MEADKLFGPLIGVLAVGGSLAVGAISIIVSVPWAYKQSLAKLEANSKERMALIERGVDPDILLKKKRTVGQDPLFWGLLLIGVGAGIFLGIMVNFWMGLNNENLTNALAILLGGVAILIHSFYRKRTDDQNPA